MNLCFETSILVLENENVLGFDITMDNAWRILAAFSTYAIALSTHHCRAYWI
jgi:hypothetical protein